jgi:hypothetical protein
MSPAESEAKRRVPFPATSGGHIPRCVEALARFAERTEAGLMRGRPGFSRIGVYRGNAQM